MALAALRSRGACSNGERDPGATPPLRKATRNRHLVEMTFVRASTNSATPNREPRSLDGLCVALGSRNGFGATLSFASTCPRSCHSSLFDCSERGDHERWAALRKGA